MKYVFPVFLIAKNHICVAMRLVGQWRRGAGGPFHLDRDHLTLIFAGHLGTKPKTHTHTHTQRLNLWKEFCLANIWELVQVAFGKLGLRKGVFEVGGFMNKLWPKCFNLLIVYSHEE